MTIEQLYVRLGEIIQNNKEKGRENFNKLPICVAVDISPRRRTYFPLESISESITSIPSPVSPKQPLRNVIELQVNIQAKVTVKT